MRNVTTALVAAMVAAGATPAAAQGAAAAWGSRGPVTCTPLTQTAPPNASQAARLLRCNFERASQSSGELRLMEDLQVQVGGPTPFAAYFRVFNMPEANTTKRVYPIRGNWTWSVCILRADAGIYGDPNLNCREAPVTNGKGVCWQTTFGDWKCTINGETGAARTKLPPRTRG